MRTTRLGCCFEISTSSNGFAAMHRQSTDIELHLISQASTSSDPTTSYQNVSDPETPPQHVKYDKCLASGSSSQSGFTEEKQGVPSSNRLVSKTGRCNVNLLHVSSKSRRFLTDFFNTVIDMKWRYNIVFYATSFVFSWVMFALVWWFIAFLHRDDESSHDDDVCVRDVHSFVTAFLFSFETQQAIGYGDRVIQTNCAHAILLFLFQSLIGACVECIVAGLIFTKLTRPKSRTQTILFSRNAVICNRNDVVCLMFRVGNLQRSHIVQTNLRAILVKSKVTAEGETIPLCQSSLELEVDEREMKDFVYLAWPVTVIHRITEKSPLWETTKYDLEITHMEIIVILEGIIESTSKNIQVRTSYLQSEILWGTQLTPLTTCSTTTGKQVVDFSNFHHTFPSAMQTGSARMYADQLHFQKQESKEDTSDGNYKKTELKPFKPLTFSPISRSDDIKPHGPRCDGNAWKRWRKVRPFVNRLGTRRQTTTS